MKARAMLVLLRGPLRDLVTFCSFEKSGERPQPRRDIGKNDCLPEEGV